MRHCCIAAVIARALIDLVAPNRRRQREARAWIFDAFAASKDIFSFEWCCHEIGQDPAQMRDAIRALSPQVIVTRLADSPIHYITYHDEAPEAA